MNTENAMPTNQARRDRPILDNLLAEGKQIYIRNKRKGIIVVSASEANGRPTRIVVPNTKHPFNLSERATRFSLENSQSLKEMLANGGVELLWPDAAEAELGKPGVRQELALAIRRVTNRANEVNQYRGVKQGEDLSGGLGNVPQVPGSSGVMDEVVAYAMGDNNAAGAARVNPHAEIEDAPREDDDDDAELANSGINPDVIRICGLVGTKEGYSIKEAKVMLAGMIEDLTNDDLGYIVSHSSGALKEWAEQALAARRGHNIPAEVLAPDDIDPSEVSA